MRELFRPDCVILSEAEGSGGGRENTPSENQSRKQDFSLSFPGGVAAALARCTRERKGRTSPSGDGEGNPQDLVRKMPSKKTFKKFEKN